MLDLLDLLNLLDLLDLPPLLPCFLSPLLPHFLGCLYITPAFPANIPCDFMRLTFCFPVTHPTIIPNLTLTYSR